MTQFRVLVCGGRNYADRDRVFAELDRLDEALSDPICVIAGGASGADALAEEWARSRIGKRDGISFHGFKADWAKHGRAAGPIRNQAMIDRGRPNLVLAFPGGRGTADMVARANEAGIPVRAVQ
jgi:hypothetical protein